MISPPRYWLLAFVFSVMLGCDSGPIDPAPTVKELKHLITSESLILNPTGYTPLAAELTLKTAQSVQVELEIVSPYDGEESLIHRFEESDTSFTLPVLGLYPSHTNRLQIRFYNRENQLLGQETRLIETPPLIVELPVIRVHVNTGRKKSGMNLVSYALGPPNFPFIFDQYGHIRWYANMVNHPTLNRLFYDVGVERLRNGNLYFGDISTHHIYEMDMLGRVINEWALPGYNFHHNVLELPSGNLLVTVSKHELPTVEDHVIEIDRETGMIVTVWDLRESVDSYRRTWFGDARDWFHANGLAYDKENDAIIVSGRHQGIVKLTRNNKVIWILAPHRGWDLSGDGTDLKTKLLQPLDANGRPITDLRVLAGFSDHSEFSWAWYQHAPKLTPHGTLLLFDNGIGRASAATQFSRAVEYHIDEKAMTIQQVWEYGRERGRETYSPFLSDVDYHHDTNTVIFMPGNNDEYGFNGKMIEVDYTTKDVVYEAVLRYRMDIIHSMFHRIERFPIYPAIE